MTKKFLISSKLTPKIYNQKKFFKPDNKDLKISKEIITCYHQLKKKYHYKSEWTWINKNKRSIFINSLINKDFRKTSELLANFFKNETSYGVISWDFSKLKNSKNFISSITKDYLIWSEFVKVKKSDEKYLNTKNKSGNFYGLNVNNNKISAIKINNAIISVTIMWLVTVKEYGSIPTMLQNKTNINKLNINGK